MNSVGILIYHPREQNFCWGILTSVSKLSVKTHSLFGLLVLKVCAVGICGFTILNAYFSFFCLSNSSINSSPTHTHTHNIKAVSLFSVLLTTIAQKTASQVVLRSCSKAVWSGRSVHINEFGEGGYAQSSTHLSRRLLLIMRTRCLRWWF